MTQGLKISMKRRLSAVLAGLFLLGAASSPALVSFDFETPYLSQPGNQVWDFCIVPTGGVYHAFYHTIPQQTSHPANADTIWHAVSDDLRRWDIRGPALTAGPDWWDDVAMWAPDVVFDPQSGRWAMLYTGVAAGMVQRACLAWSDDLETWNKSEANPVFEPDSITYFWSPSEEWSSFRDPFLYHDGQVWNMLSTAQLRLGGVPGYRRGIVHRATSPDLVNWQDAGVFFEHDGVGGRSNALESVQYLVRGGWHHLFFTEQDPAIENHPTSHLVASDPSGWTMLDREIIDPGWAPEIEPFLAAGDLDIFARLAKDVDPRDGTSFVTMKLDSVRFDSGGQVPVIIPADPWSDDWPIRLGSAAEVGPVFGDNPVWRDDPGMGPGGHGWFGSFENYGGPLMGVGQPGSFLGDGATGRLESRAFVLTGENFRLRLGGGASVPGCYVGLVDNATDELLTTLRPNGASALTERYWNVGAFVGRTVRMVIVDEAKGNGGWLAVDDIEELAGTSAATGQDPALFPVADLAAVPNPFNARTEIRFELRQPGSYRLDIHDLGGRRVWRVEDSWPAPGTVVLTWDGRDAAGRPLPSGTYFCRVVHEGRTVAMARLALVK